jgi:arylsulfatase A-like enzyme
LQTGRIPNRSGMTTVAFQGQGGGLPAAEWTLASVLKTAGYKTFFTGKWHLGEDNSSFQPETDRSALLGPPRMCARFRNSLSAAIRRIYIAASFPGTIISKNI